MDKTLSPQESALRERAREYHRYPQRGKISVTPTKPLSNQLDLSLAYSPGVAYPCLDIQADPAKASEYTSRGNLVAVITNGSAVLGLGNIGPLAGKPVMEGKACLFKKYAGIDVFDIELDASDPDLLVDTIATLEPTVGGINLEDIKAPECFYVEQKLRERLSIPVFHDDQHGTAIISSAALLNGLELTGKHIAEIKLVVSGAGAAAIACLDLMVALGVSKENIYVCDSKGLIYKHRQGDLSATKARYAREENRAGTLADVVQDADVFLGCSTAGVLTQAMVKTMADQPVILALANPNPEITPEDAKAARPDCIIATGRSDYPNQVNNVLCFPYIFRGALDCGARKITEEMKLACVYEIANLAKAELSAEVAAVYQDKALRFGADYIIPTPFDPRLVLCIAPAVAKAAAEAGVADRPIADFEAYRKRLSQFVYQTGMVMQPVLSTARNAKTLKRVVYAEGEDTRVLHAVQTVVDDHIARPVLIGRPAVIEQRMQAAGLRFAIDTDVDVVDPEDDPRFKATWQCYHKLMARDGISMEAAKAAVRHSNTLIAALLVTMGEADAMLCGLVGAFDDHLQHVRHVIGMKPEASDLATLNAVLLHDRTLFITDTYVHDNPSSDLLVEIADMAAREIENFGLPPKVAFLSHSNFGTSKRASARKMRAARDKFVELFPATECDGEMQGDNALSAKLRQQNVNDGTLDGEANLLVCPNLDAANILFNVLKMTSGGGVTIGPVLLGSAKPAHVLTPSTTSRRLINMTALAVAECIAAEA